jgi:cytochrome c553
VINAKKTARLDPTPSVLKKLFALSGNMCAMPTCENRLIHKTGTMVGKVAHIHAAEKGGARYLAAMTDEDRRLIDNLFVVCANCHDVVDDPKNATMFPAAKLKKIKEKHEDSFRKAEQQFIEKYSDLTQLSQPTFPKTLYRMASLLGWPDVLNSDDDIRDIGKFIRKLSELPIEQRQFALSLAERMKRRNLEKLPFDDVSKAFAIGLSKLKKQMQLLEHHQLGSVEEATVFDQYNITLWHRDRGGNPFIEILDFCEKSGNLKDEFIVDLNFALYD